MLNIAICDDDSQELKQANALLINYMNENPQIAMNIHLFSAPFELLDHVSTKGGFDIILLDVYMPGMIGIDVARELRSMGDRCQIIFLTTSRDYAVDAFSLNAAHYLVKPYAEASFATAMNRALETISKYGGAITVKSTEGTVRINFSDLVYTETENQLQRLNMSDGRIVRVRKTSLELYELLEDDPRFFKCGSTYIINMDYVVAISSRTVDFSNGITLPMLSRKYAEFKKQYMDYVCSR